MSLFRVYVDGALFYHPQITMLAITDARIEEDAENIDSMTLSAPFNHPYLSGIRPLASTIVCKKGDAVVFEGRALDNGTDFYNTHTWTCESCLAYEKGEDGTMVINKDQAKVVERIYGLFTAGLSPKAIAKRLTEEGAPTPGGQEKWYEGTVRSILKNEKYKGCALLQKTYTPDFLTKKAVKNDGSVPQYYVEDSHPAIIDPDQFQLVQDIFKERASDPKHSGATIFSGKIRCGCCGGWYGSKVWHSNDKYRRVVWQCNSKFKDKTRCKTPHLTEDEVKAAFIRLVNKLSTDREFYVTELTAIKDRLGETTALEKERRILDEQLGIDAKAVNDLIARNARVAQDQKEYNERYDALVSRYEETEKKRDAVMEKIDQIMIRRRKIERFIESMKDLPEIITEFDESLWAGLVDSMTVHGKDRIVFRLTCSDGLGPGEIEV